MISQTLLRNLRRDILLCYKVMKEEDKIWEAEIEGKLRSYMGIDLETDLYDDGGRFAFFDEIIIEISRAIDRLEEQQGYREE